MRQYLLGLMLLGFTHTALSREDCASAFGKGGELKSAAAAVIERAVTKDFRLPTAAEVSVALELSATQLRDQLGEGSWKQQLQRLVADHHMIESSAKLLKLQAKLIKQWLEQVAEFHRIPDWGVMSAETGIPIEIVKLMLGDEKDVWQTATKSYKREVEALRRAVAKAYAFTSKEHGRTLESDEFLAYYGGEGAGWVLKSGVFRDFADLKALARVESPKSFEDVIDLDIFNEQRAAELLEAVTTKKRLLVTTAVSGAPVDKSFLAAAKIYCAQNDAALIVIPANMKTHQLDEALLSEPWIHVLTNEVEISQFLRISNIKITAKQFNPLTSLDNIGPRSQSVIVSSPKMHAKVVPTTANSESPHILYSTGAITLPNYSGRKFIQQRTDYIAKNQHRMGALLLERVSATQADPKTSGFHARHIEYIAERQGFFDLDKFYGAKGIEPEAPIAMVLGDVHVAKLDRVAFERAKKEIARLRPRVVVIHDNFDGDTVNGHTAMEMITRGVQAQERNTSVAKEIIGVIDFQNELLALYPDLQVWIVRSNHDLWLDKWIQSGEFMRDPQNQAIGILLAEAMAVQNFANPLEYAVKHLPEDPRATKLNMSKLSDPARVRFLELGSNETIGPEHAKVLVGLHGHAGVNGAKGISLKSLARIAGRSIKAHTHTMARENEAVNVGTLTKLDLGYNRDGVSNWVQSVAIIGPNGEIQVLVFRDGEYFAVDGNRKKREFFAEGYPILVPNQLESDAGQIDQYGE